MNPKRVWLDTDIGTDVDDLFALALLLRSPEVQLEGLSCVYGAVGLRARIALKALSLHGRADVPVFMGMGRSLLNLRPVFWGGHEGKVALAGDTRTPQESGVQAEHAVDALIRMAETHPGQIHLLCIGPLTNLAMALLRAPHIAQHFASITIMGGAMRGRDTLHLGYAEHNILCDPEAAHIVFTSGAPITLIPLDVTERVAVTSDDVDALRATGSPFNQLLADEFEAWLPVLEKVVNLPRTYTHMHDPLAAAFLIDPQVVTTMPVRVDVELRGSIGVAATLMRAPADPHAANVQVAIETDTPRFRDLFFSRLMQA